MEKTNNIIGNYQKYKWFFTSSEKLVVGGKSSEQNDELLRKLKMSNKDFIVMHTSTPGSPFCIIIDNIENVKEKDINETAIFTGCFSRAWKLNKKNVEVDIFFLSQLYKKTGMKNGTWGIKGNVNKKIVKLEIVLIKQEGKLRAVPEITSKKYLLKIRPGKIDKSKMLLKLQVELHEDFSKEELLSALPAGGIEIVREGKNE